MHHEASACLRNPTPGNGFLFPGPRQPGTATFLKVLPKTPSWQRMLDSCNTAGVDTTTVVCLGFTTDGSSRRSDRVQRGVLCQPDHASHAAPRNSGPLQNKAGARHVIAIQRHPACVSCDAIPRHAPVTVNRKRSLETSQKGASEVPVFLLRRENQRL